MKGIVENGHKGRSRVQPPNDDDDEDDDDSDAGENVDS